MKKVFSLLILLLSNLSISQDQTTNLDEVVVLSTKIDLPFSKNFRTVKIISSEEKSLVSPLPTGYKKGSDIHLIETLDDYAFSF